MLVNTKAKVGVFSIALGAYLPQFPSLVPEFEAQYEAFKKTIPDTVEIIDGGMVTTKEQSMAAGDKFRAADVDLVFLQMLTYATSYNMLPAIRDLNVPVVLVNVQKLKALDYDHTDIATWLGEGYACGAVGEAVADLERAGKRHAVITGVVEGGDPDVQAEIEDWCKAAQVRRRFRDTNIAQIGRPYPGMMDLYIDETNLYNRMFLYTKQFDWEKMWAIADDITDEDAIRAKAQDILDTFDIEGGGTIEKVWDMAKYVVAFEEWVKKEELGMVAANTVSMAHRSPLNRRQKAALPTLTRSRSVQRENLLVRTMERNACSISAMLTLLSTGSQLNSLSCWIRFTSKL